MVTFFFFLVKLECVISVSFLTFFNKQLLYQCKGIYLFLAYINSTNIVKIGQLYLNDRAKYCVRGVKQTALLLIS